MKRKIICIIQPFVLKQTIYVYENDNKLQVFEEEIENLPNIIFNLSEKYHIKEIRFYGSKNYSKNIENEIKKIQLLNYNKNNLIFIYN